MAVVFAALPLRRLRVCLRSLLRGSVCGGGAGLAPVAPTALAPCTLRPSAPRVRGCVFFNNSWQHFFQLSENHSYPNGALIRLFVEKL
jgi:hypothetical protein